MVAVNLPSWQSPSDGWQSQSEYQIRTLELTQAKFYEVSDLLIERPNLNSTHLFRADILLDTLGTLQTVFQKNELHKSQTRVDPAPMVDADADDDLVDTSDGYGEDTVVHETSNTTPESSLPVQSLPPPVIPGFERTRTVVRRLIPRKPRVDRPMDQSCFTYSNFGGRFGNDPQTLVVYVPHASSADDMPWYHPKVKSLAYHYSQNKDGGMIAVHYQLFVDSEHDNPDRLHRTMLSLAQTFARLSKLEAPANDSAENGRLPPSQRIMTPAALKDTLLPQHIVQDTYARLKQKYAANLIARWVEKTDPSKYVFQELAIAAFLIELWAVMYRQGKFPGFVDTACGNGVLTSILINEGFHGRGFDARRRKSWAILGIDEYLEEKLCVPKPFIDVLNDSDLKDVVQDLDVHDGIFPPGTFIVAIHSDELTLWTPILAALSGTDACLPFLAIPCCSHALSGVRHRYNISDVEAGYSQTLVNKDEQPSKGDLKELRARKKDAPYHHYDKSAYECLTRKTVAIAEELGADAEMTLMRIPSTRNIAVVGNRHMRAKPNAQTTTEQVQRLLERECQVTEGFQASARGWVEWAKQHLESQGKGKVKQGAQTVQPPTEGSPPIHYQWQDQGLQNFKDLEQTYIESPLVGLNFDHTDDIRRI